MGFKGYWWDHCIMKRLKKLKDEAALDKNKKTVIAITPTYVHVNQSRHFCELTRTLVNLPYNVIWIVVEAGGPTNETAKRFSKELRQLVEVKHVGFDYNIPSEGVAREKMEAQMRLQALRVVKEEKLDGIVIFADEADHHDRKFFYEIQKVRWIGSVPIIVGRDGSIHNEKIIQAPACNNNSSLHHQNNGWRIHSRPCRGCNVSDIVLPEKLKWSEFVMNSRLVWKEESSAKKPEWINKDLDMIMAAGNHKSDEINNPLSFVKDSSMVEALGGCGLRWLICRHCENVYSYCYY
uniref:beta-1,4-xylosyltransferase IRX14-like n=1 Tax=Erigeron canadensis TaxID=72917 RepID=UPI001CB8FE1C|nr:beta-1,4-xylosyltransferase IRX14-like [Erigeron canadensis]